MSGSPHGDRLRLALDLDPAAGRPSGELVDQQGLVTPFVGWLELMDGLDDARRRAAAASPALKDQGGSSMRPAAPRA